MKKLITIIILMLTLTLLVSCGECEHDWKDAGCTEPKTCAKCGATEGEPTNHALGEWVVTAPGCEEDGSRTRSCACGAVLSKNDHIIYEEMRIYGIST